MIHDLEISGPTANGLNIDDGGQFSDPTAAHHVVVRNLYVHDVGTGGNQDCVKVSGINTLAIYDSVIERCGTGGSGIDHVGCHRSIVARNVFDGRMENAVQAKGGSTDIDIRQNRSQSGMHYGVDRRTKCQWRSDHFCTRLQTGSQHADVQRGGAGIHAGDL